MSEVEVNLFEVAFYEIKDIIYINLRFHETIIEKILWKVNAFLLDCFCIKDNYKNLFNVISGLLYIYIKEHNHLNHIFNY